MQYIIGFIFLGLSLFPLKRYFYWRAMGDFGWTYDHADRNKLYFFTIFGLALLILFWGH